MKKNKQVELPKTQMRGFFQPSSVDEKNRTIEIIFTTGARVLRYGWDGKFYEELLVTPESVNLERLNNGAPLLNIHSDYTLTDILGVVEKAWIENGEGHALVRFSERDDVEPLFKDVMGGIIRNVSVGYSTEKLELVEDNADGIPVYRATAWTPLELSLVAVPADPKAGTRSREQELSSCEIIEKTGGNGNMAVKKEKNKRELDHKDPNLSNVEGAPAEGAAAEETPPAEEAAPAAAEETPPAEEAAPAEDAPSADAETERASQILTLTREYGKDLTFAENCIKNKRSISEVKDLILEENKRMNENTKINGASVKIEKDERDKLRTAVENVILFRVDPKTAIKEGSDFVGMTMKELSRMYLERTGHEVKGLDAMRIAERALSSSSDFPLILANVAGKVLRTSYEDTVANFTGFVKEIPVNDFKEISSVQLGDFPSLAEVLEGGEYKTGKVGEEAEKYKVKSYGKIFGITRTAIVNDDLRAFSRIPQMAGAAAKRLELDLVWAQITSNPKMSDGKDLFGTDHKNLAGTPAALSITTLGGLKQLMRAQKTIDKNPMNIIPKFLAVGSYNEVLGQQLLTQIFATEAAKINVFAGSLQLIVEPRLDAASGQAQPYFLIADPNQVDTIELAYLAGQRVPSLETKLGFEVDGVQFKVRHEIGVKAIDWRGMAKQTGVANS